MRSLADLLLQDKGHPTMATDKQKTILLVDDEPLNLRLLQQLLQGEYRLLVAKDGQRAIELAGKEVPDLILLDVMMPGMTGYEACKILKQQAATARIPVIFVTALNEEADEATGFAVGAVDYITKPYGASVVRARVRNHLSLVRAEDLLATRQQVVHCLGKAAEYKDNETGLHVIRMSHYSRLLAETVGYEGDELEDLFSAAPMHDVGKIGIPDAILRKPGRLTPEELEVMRKHPEIGAMIIGENQTGMLALAYNIALCHHEKWDGSGYPRGLKARDIPLEARIVAIADVYDALTTIRPYKRAWSVEEAVAHLREQAGSHFDPQLVENFLTRLPEVLEVAQRWGETTADLNAAGASAAAAQPQAHAQAEAQGTRA
jgi:putative two-component system response regulator